jgi:peptidoglycan/xylan/chitin deacetylase (PgdA/CDA1 family)
MAVMMKALAAGCVAFAAALTAASAQTPAPAPAPVTPPVPQLLSPGAACPGNPNALGTSRVMEVSVEDYRRVGIMQYRTTIPLEDREVVLTFDDGPLPPYTTRVLETLSAECVRATFFIVGRMARAYPEHLRDVVRRGHTIATHSQTHPLIFPKLSQARGISEIEDGFSSTIAALGDPKLVAPWFRFPGLGRTNAFEQHLQRTGRSVWSAEIVGDDWLQISADEVLKRTLSRIEARGRGIVLLHDIQPRTANMLPSLLRELKARGYRIVHLVPKGSAAGTAAAPGLLPASAPAADPMRAPWPRFPGQPGPAPAPANTPAAPKPEPPKPEISGQKALPKPAQTVDAPGPALFDDRLSAFPDMPMRGSKN